MKFKSENMTQASGSIAGVTYAHTKGGVLYRRARAIPTNPSSSNQVLVRSLLAAYVTAWIETLSAVQRAAWDLYAANVSVVNPLGDPVNNSGQNWYVACNVPRNQAASKLVVSLATVNAAPTIFDRGTLAAASAAYDETSGLTLTYDDTEDWTSEDGAALLIYQGRPISPGRNFFKGPYRLVGAVLGDSTTPPASPEILSAANLTANGFTVTTGQKVATALALTRADGRLSTRQLIAPAIVT